MIFRFTPTLRVAALLGCLMMRVGVMSQNITVSSAVGQQLESFLNAYLVGNGVTVSNAMFNGTVGTVVTDHIGTFSSNGFAGLSMDAGVLMTTGCISVAQGPNNADGASSAQCGYFSDSQLQPLASDVINGCATLDFDFMCNATTVEFNYVFASEEYPEYVCSEFNDIFAFFISGPDPEGGTMNRNIAIIPGTVTVENPDGVVVAINSVNPGTVTNSGCYSQYSQYYNSNPSGNAGIQYDGYTVKLTATANIVPGATYHMHLSICNVGDNQFDSGVFLEANSFAPPIHELIVNGEYSQSHNQEVTICLTDTVHLATSTTGVDTTVLWIIDGVPQADMGMELNHHFTTTGDHTVVALMHGLCYPAWCDTLTALVHIFAPSAEELTMVTCDESVEFHGQTFSETGDYSVIKTMAQGCDSAFNLHLTVNHSSNSVVTETVVENQLPIVYNGHTFTGPVEHATIVLTNTQGCDSTIDYSLYVNWNVGTIVDSTVCADALPVHWNGLNFNTAGTQQVVMQSSSGADSTVTMTLHVNPTYSILLQETICNNQSCTFEGDVFTVPGTYISYFTSIAGCDSVRTLTLMVNDTTIHHTTVNVCDSYTWHGSTYTTSTEDALMVGPNSVGCDSTEYLHLIVRHSTEREYFDTIVENQLPYLFCGTMFTADASGSVFHTTNTQGCDSTITYSLKVWWNTTSLLDTTVCDDALPLQFNGHTFASAGVSVDSLYTTHFADSVVTTTVYVNPTYSIVVDASICDNEIYSFEGTTYTTAGSHPHLLVSSLGCDSVRILMLQVRATTVGDTSANECDQFVWYGINYTMSGDVATHLSTNAAGCDSTTTLHLMLRGSTESAYMDTVVENLLPRMFNGTSFTDSISHATVTIANAAACDSVIDYSLFVHWNRDTVLDSTVCNDMLPLTWTQSSGTVIVPTVFDTTITSSVTMVRTVIIPTHVGSDSIITMHLLVHPLYDHHLSVSICDNQNYIFGDSLFNGTVSHVDHTDSLHSIYGCDSLSTLHLDIWPTFDHHLYDTVCANQSYVWGSPQRVMVPPATVTLWLHGSDSAMDRNVAVVDTMFTDHLSSVHSCDSLSSLHLRLLPAYDLHYRDTMCDAGWQSGRTPEWQSRNYSFETATYTVTGNYQHQLSTLATTQRPLACDSTRTLHLRVYPTYDMHFYDTIYDGDTYTFEQVLYDTTGVYPRRFEAVYACDSLRTLHLQRNRRTYVDSVICQNALPLTWHHMRGNTPMHTVFQEGDGVRGAEWQTIKDSVHLLGLDNIDSLVVMTVIARDTSATFDVQHSCDSLIWRNGVTYTSSTAEPWVLLQNHWGCDSVRHLDLTVDYTSWYTDRQVVCDSMEWINGEWYYRDTIGTAGPLGSGFVVGPVDTLVTKGGCDSVVNLDLSVHYSVFTAAVDTFCYDETYTWHDFSVHSDDEYSTIDYHLTDTLLTVWQCDSVVGLLLTKLAKPTIIFDYDIDCANLWYNLSVTTDVGYSIWSSDPFDPMLDGQEQQRQIRVSPESIGDYMIYVAYHDGLRCPLTDQITLRKITIPTAQIHVTPDALSYKNLEFNAYDISEEYTERVWYVDWVPQSETSRKLVTEADILADTVTVALSVFNSQCWDTVSQRLPIRKVVVFAPNVFTPDQEDNNRFVLSVQGVIDGELSIYNREGLLVYRTKDFTGEGWNGEGCPQGGYVWKLEYRGIDYPAASQVEVGTVLLLK